LKEVHSYVIRLYRRDAQSCAGLVEDVQRNRSTPFQSLAELCEYLAGRKPFPRRKEHAALHTKEPS
jgi:hypothetical protein